MLDRKTPSEQVFEYRHAASRYKRHSLNQWQTFLLIEVLMLAFAVGMAALIFLPDKKLDFGHFWQWFTSRPFAVEADILLAPTILLVLFAINWLERRSTLAVTQGELIFRQNLPFGLDALFRTGWRISLADISEIQILYNPVIAGAPEILVAKTRIRDKSGASHIITPSAWFIPGGSPHPLPKPAHAPFLSMGISENWRTVENKTILQKAFSDFPIVRALTEHHPNFPYYDPSKNSMSDLFAHRSIQFGIVTGLSLVVAALLLIILRQNSHLQDGLPIWLYVSLVLAALYLYWKIDQKESPPAPTGNRILALIFLVGGVIIGASQVISLLNGLGVDSGHEQAFVVRADNLEPIDPTTGTGKIKLPGENSRHAWLKEGTEVKLFVKKGRLGLWEFNDEPLRQLANQQGIR
jgi:hypothetical protein